MMRNESFSRESVRRAPVGRMRPRTPMMSDRLQAATAVLVVDRDPIFCGELARLARLKGVGAAFAWGAENVERLTLAGFGAAIVNTDEWATLTTSKDRRVQAFLTRVPIVLVSNQGGGSAAAFGPVRAIVPKAGGANAALLAAIEAPLTLVPQLDASDH